MRGTICDKEISNTMNYSRYLQIKLVLKLNVNNKAIDRVELRYKPASKFDLILKAIVHKFHTITKYTLLDLKVDETI